HPWEPSYPNNCADPIFSGYRVFVSAAYDAGCALLRFKAGSAEVVWKNKEMNNHFSSCVLLDGMLYGFDGDVRRGKTSLKCIEFKTGKVKWATRLKGSLLVADGKLIILTTAGELIIAEASPKAHKQLARAKVLSGKCWTPPVLAGGRVFCRSHEGDLVCVDLKKPRP
ncbi:MAG: PQQ-binding-like beta-propeller repeat protein, partial [Planctomycetota bacterium]